jgi:type II secretory pathway component PulF
VQVEFVKFNRKILLFVEDEVLASMNSNGSKSIISMNYKGYKDGKIPFRALYYSIYRQIQQGNSTFTMMSEVKELFDMKEYYTINKEEYSDYYENKILHTKSR